MSNHYFKSPSSEPYVRVGHPHIHQLTGFWPMTEGAGTSLNCVVQRPNEVGNIPATKGRYGATGTNSPTWTDSPWGPAISLNGTNQYYTVADPNNDGFINSTTNGGTILTAFCPTGNGGAQANTYDQPNVVCNSAGYWGISYGSVAAVNTVFAWLYDGAVRSTNFQSITLNQWISVAWKYDGTNINVYRDGIKQSSSTGGGGVGINTGSVYFGRNYAGATFFPGFISYVAIYYYPISDQKIMQWAQMPFELLSRPDRLPRLTKAVAGATFNAGSVFSNHLISGGFPA